MDRRQRKTRDAIFRAFCDLLSQKHYNQITVGEIIQHSDIGRATFYAHFETKDALLKELCQELFCHIFDAACDNPNHHSHIFQCDAPSSVCLHILQHLQKNDHNILKLLTCENNQLFLGYFKENLKALFENQLPIYSKQKPEGLPDSLWSNILSSAFIETVRWWIDNGMKESPQRITDYFHMVL